ncbi:Protease-associated domain-containing protein 1 [Lamellibrachia satsuma]|nr:Protease-associated domain-containing protein 1 [Lamellibrachia satsuma]
MAYDVRIFIFLSKIILLLLSEVNGEDEYDIITKPLFMDNNYFFELTEPSEISYTYKLRPAKDFGPRLNSTYVNMKLVPTVPVHGCSAISNDITDSVAFIERGGCSFVGKTINAERAGARLVVITDHAIDNDNRMIDMIQDETSRTVGIPAFFLIGKDGHMIRRTLEKLKLTSALINIPINITGIPLSRVNHPPWSFW